jgi:hypothetical protein
MYPMIQSLTRLSFLATGMIGNLEQYGEPRLRAMLCMGGLDLKEQVMRSAVISTTTTITFYSHTI